MGVVAKRYSSDVYRLMEEGRIVGFALRLANGQWSMTDLEDRKMDDVTYASPGEVARCFGVVRLLTRP